LPCYIAAAAHSARNEEWWFVYQKASSKRLALNSRVSGFFSDNPFISFAVGAPLCGVKWWNNSTGQSGTDGIGYQKPVEDKNAFVTRTSDLKVMGGVPAAGFPRPGMYCWCSHYRPGKHL
jgi:hypothetical protein